MDLTLRAIVAVVAAALGAAMGALLLIQWRTHRARQIAALWPGALVDGPPWQRVVSLVTAAGLLGAAAFWPTPPRLAADRTAAAIVFALDVSRSMSADDIPPARLAAAVGAMNALARAINGPIAVNAFAGESAGLAPFTSDRGAIELALREATTAAPQLAGGSAPAVAIGAALDLLQQGGRHGAIVLASDGEWTDDSGLEAALVRSATAGVPIYTLGVGTSAGVSMASARPAERGASPDTVQSETRITRLEARALQALSARTGGRSWTLPGAEIPAGLAPLLQTSPPTSSIPGEWLRRLFWIAAFVLLLAGSGSPLRGGALVPAGALARPGAAFAVVATLAAASCADRGGALREGNRAFDRGENAEALADYGESAARGELADRAWFNSGLVHHRAGKIADSLEAFSRAASIAASDEVRALAHFNRGNVMAAEGQLDVAESAFIDALRANPDFEAARVNLAIVRERLKPPDSEQPPPPPVQPPPRYAFPRTDLPRKPPVESDW